jgi:hypothetical protein
VTISVYLSVNQAAVRSRSSSGSAVKLSGAFRVGGASSGQRCSDIQATRPSGTRKNRPTTNAVGAA